MWNFGGINKETTALNVVSLDFEPISLSELSSLFKWIEKKVALYLYEI